MNSSFGVVDGKPSVVRHTHVNLGIAIDLKKDDGSRTLLVPNIKSADTLDFAAFHAAYEELIRKARTNKLAVDDFTGPTVSITNPGTIGTMHSVPPCRVRRIIGVGAITPAEFEGASANLAEIGISKIVTSRAPMTTGSSKAPRAAPRRARVAARRGRSTRPLRQLRVPYEPALSRHKPLKVCRGVEKALAVSLINMYRSVVTSSQPRPAC
jgi:hypothetical protein